MCHSFKRKNLLVYGSKFSPSLSKEKQCFSRQKGERIHLVFLQMWAEKPQGHRESCGSQRFHTDGADPNLFVTTIISRADRDVFRGYKMYVVGKMSVVPKSEVLFSALSQHRTQIYLNLTDFFWIFFAGKYVISIDMQLSYCVSWFWRAYFKSALPCNIGRKLFRFMEGEADYRYSICWSIPQVTIKLAQAGAMSQGLRPGLPHECRHSNTIFCCPPRHRSDNTGRKWSSQHRKHNRKWCSPQRQGFHLLYQNTGPRKNI